MADGETKSANGSGARSEIVRKPSRRSPTTGHRRKKTDLKRSQSSPREEAIVPTSSDDERNAPVRRKSLSPGLGPEPKKVLRRRHRVKEKNEETKDVTKETKNEDTAVNSILKKQASNAQSPATKMEDEPKRVNASMSEPKSRTTNTPAAPKDDDEEIFRTTKIDGAPKAERQKSIDSKPKENNGELRDAESAVENDEAKSKTENENEKQNDCKEDKATRPISWWGGWSPFSRETEPAEATGFDSRGEDYVTSDDETAMEFVKLLSGNRNNKKVEVRKSISSLNDAKSLLDDAKSSLDDAKSSLTDETRPLLGQNGEGVKSWSQIVRESRAEFAKYKKEFPQETATLKKLRNRCICELLIMFIFCGCGAFVFKTTEGTFESFYKCGVKRVKRDFIDDLWRSSHFMKEEDWKSKARSKLWQFENQLQEAFEAGVNTYSGQKSWSFINGVIYCLTVVTTIGYGHIAPVTNSGRALTIAYSIIGIPLFLILLADFGKLFTRGIKFLWAFVRRVYYTGSCKKVRRTGPVQEVMKGVQMMYETIRRPSMFPQGPDGECPGQENLGTPGDPPSTPALSVFAIDDEFNLPISVAITILLVYIFMGATVFWCWEEDWTFFESFYFVFISMSTIGFGDLVPKNQMYMMLSIVYLAFGLALTSMCINVVQEKLSDSFRKASAKIGATIGLKVSDDDGTISPVSPTHVEIAEVHKSLRAPAIQLMANPQHEVS